MPTYAFSSKSVICNPAVDHAAAARAAFAAGDYAGALPHFFCAFSASPVDLDLHMLSFQAMVRCGLHSSSTLSEAVLDTLGNERWAVIAQIAREHLVTNPQDEGAALILARVTYIVSSPAERTALIAQLQAINPQNPVPFLFMAQNAATTHKDAAETTRLLENALRLAPDDPEILCWIADLYVILEAIKDYPRALSLYDQALSLNPELTAAFFGRGLTQQEQGNFATAHADLAAALQLTPFDYRIHNARAKVFQSQGDDTAALAAYKQVLEINPASYWALKGVAELGTRLNNLADRKAVTQAFLSSHVPKPVEAALTPSTPVHFRLLGMEASVVKATLGQGQHTTFAVEPLGGDKVFAAVLLVAPDGGAVVFVHRTFDSDPIIKLPLTAAIAGEYMLMVTFNGIGEEEFIVSME